MLQRKMGCKKMKTEKEIREHLAHLEGQKGNYYHEYSKECNQSIEDGIEGAIITIKWILEMSDMRAA